MGLAVPPATGLRVGALEGLAVGLFVGLIGLRVGNFVGLPVTGLRVVALDGLNVGLLMGPGVLGLGSVQNGTLHSSHRLSGSVV